MDTTSAMLELAALRDFILKSDPLTKRQTKLVESIQEVFSLEKKAEQLQEALRVRGGCRMLSDGEGCDCGLCKRDKEIERLHAIVVAGDNLSARLVTFLEFFGDHSHTTDISMANFEYREAAKPREHKSKT